MFDFQSKQNSHCHSRRSFLNFISSARLSTPLAVHLASFLCFVYLAGCASNYDQVSATNTVTSGNQQSTLESSLTGAKIIFKYDSFYSLTSPNPSTRCAGDSNVFYDVSSTLMPSYPSGYAGFTGVTGPLGPYPLPISYFDQSTTIRPSFIKNVSVDLTDTNANSSSNDAYTCSLGNGSGAPPVSNCATFDYGAIDGIPSSLGGSVFLLGGLQSYNYSGVGSSNSGLAVSCGPAYSSANLSYPTGYNSCNTSLYALGVNTLPASAAKSGSTLTPGLTSANGPISTWQNLAANSAVTTPPGNAGGNAIYNSILKIIMTFAGAVPLDNVGPTGYGAPSFDTWIYDVQDQVWTHLNTLTTVNSSMTTLQDGSNSLNKAAGGRSLFGYAAVAGTAINRLSSNGNVYDTSGSAGSGAGIDTTDRIFTVGGLGDCTDGICTDVHRFNPTFGPEYFDASGTNAVTNPTGAPVQWIDSYHTQLVSNNSESSKFKPKFLSSTGTPSTYSVLQTSALSFGLVGLNNFQDASTYVNTGIQKAGYLLAIGGFDGTATTSKNTSNDLTHGGGMTLFGRLPGLPGSTTQTEGNTENSVSFFSFLTNFKDSNFTLNSPGQWYSIPDYSVSSTNTFTLANAPYMTPWLGAAVLVNGHNKNYNDVLYFGGVGCKHYLPIRNQDTSTNCTGTNLFASSGASIKYRFGSSPFRSGTLPPYPDTVSVPTYSSASDVPINAGMASARGADLGGHPLIVAWGGITGLGSSDLTDQSGKIYYSFNNLSTTTATTDSSPRWATYIPSDSSPRPQGLSNASLVYSHITKKFYLFGGYNLNLGYIANTWELSLDPSNSANTSCGLSNSATGKCTFIWRQLNVSGGLTCYPGCPSARRSHRVVEVNYNNINPSAEPSCSSSSAPCSFGIFMEGGTPDGTTSFSERWMFDPTANAGFGHWQQVGGQQSNGQAMTEMPPRVLASLTNVDYFVPSSNTTANRALLFGGETAMANPALSVGYNGNREYFVPPTLGDTWMFDFSKKAWNRVTLAGSFTTAITSINSWNRILTPPPLSGGVMVTRTFSKPNHKVDDAAAALAIPEIFLIGGRKKDGTYHSLNNIYKFCSGTTDETASSGSSLCNSSAITGGFIGRWLYKDSPSTTNSDGTSINPRNLGSFMGAAAYDPDHDLILLYGGLSSSDSSVASSTKAVTDSAFSTSTSVLEYTPPTVYASTVYAPGSAPTNMGGSWNAVPVCSETETVPSGRYGHSLIYDTIHKNIVVVGGYNKNGAPLIQHLTASDGTAYTVPEVWTAYRIDVPLPNGNSELGIPAITGIVGSTSSFSPCYYWKPISLFGNSISSKTQAPPASAITHASAVYIPSSGFNTGYYSTVDGSCADSGPYMSSDSALSKLLVGGAYFDIDRSKLGVHENLLLNVTYIPLGPTNTGADQNPLALTDTAYFQIHLIRTAESGDTIRARAQPRNLTYANTSNYPEIAQNIAILAPPTGEIRQEQIFLPISFDLTIDRIRLERYSGNAILIDASLYRMGNY